MTAAGPAAAEPAFTHVFESSRARLVGLAYRITGSRLDAEDIVQEAWLRARRAGVATIDRPEAWLTTVVSRLALDDLRTSRRRREEYIGPWLPEPVLTPETPVVSPAAASAGGVDPAQVTELAESLTFGFLRVLDTLSPVERVVFLLADVFDTSYAEIAAIVERSPATCRQIASRARRRVRDGRVRHERPEDADEIVLALLAAVAEGEVDRVLELLADDVVLISDGGPETRAARRPVRGARRVARFLVNLAHRVPEGYSAEPATVNGAPTLVIRIDGEPYMTITVHVGDGVARQVLMVVNPRKLAALDVTTPLV